MNSTILFFLLLKFLYCWVVAAKTDATDLAALNLLKRQWQNTPPNWKRHDPCGRKWEGILCNGSQVTAILLSGINLIGTLPEDISSLSELQKLDLSDNRGLTGPLPSNIGSLKNLERLVLSGCNFSGPIPESIGSLQKLESLFLNSNNLTGSIPHSVGNLRKLIWLDLSNNQLDGKLPVSNKTTPGLDKLSRAEHFHLGQNRFSGEMPLGLLHSDMALRHLILNDNQLNGSIPDTLILALALEVIRLDRNFLSGSVPQNLNTLINVSELYLSNNNLSGPVPDLSGMNLLTYVDLSNNSFEASDVPLWFTNLPSLTTLRMENTSLKGQLPAALFSLSNLQTVLLRNNQLSGTVDIGTSLSSDLRLIDLRNNSINEFNVGEYTHKVLLDGNSFCGEPEAKGMCKTDEPLNVSKYIPEEPCIPLSCFTDLTGSNCKCAYLGRLVFLSFNFSNLGNLSYYKFLNDDLKDTIKSPQVTKICLVSSTTDTRNDYLVLNIAFLPPEGIDFNRTLISRIGNILNDHIFDTPYGPYHFNPVPPYAFPDPAIQRRRTALIIGMTVSGFVLVLLTMFAGAYAYRQRKIVRRETKLNNPFASWNQGDLPQLNRVNCFSFEDVKECTDNFADANEIGLGGYGKVYKGKLNSGQLVAIKRAQQGSLQGALQFKTEIELLSRVHHKNIVNLVGFCYDKGEQMLIYEYLPYGSLRASLSGRSGIRLKWVRRLKVALDAARGLTYLHELADPPIIHRDIKSGNILLDDHLNAKVGDFGLSKPVSNDQDHITTQVKGTMGYLDPEYYTTRQLTEKSDVYSFGVVMLELVTGRLPIERNKENIVKEVKITMSETGYIYKLVDPVIRFGTLIGLQEFVELALTCLQDSGDKRPSTGEVAKEIEGIIQAGKKNMNAVLSSFGGTREDGTRHSNSDFAGGRANNPFLR